MNKWLNDELALLEKGQEGDSLLMQRKMNDCVIEVMEVIEKQGHSGTTVSYLSHVLDRVIKRKPLTPLTGEDSEWQDTGFNDEQEQNRRCPTVFRYYKDNKTAYDIHGKVFSDDGGKVWYTSKESTIEITFPYSPPDEPEKILLPTAHDGTQTENPLDN